MTTQSPQVSVIIRTRNEGHHIGATLKAVVEQVYSRGLEIIVVDNESTDDTVQVARTFGVTILTLEAARFSFGRALNLGARIAHGEYLVHLSGDAVPARPDYLATLVAPLARGEVAATYGRNLPKPGCCPSETRDLGDWFPPSPRPLPHPFMSNANAAVRRSIWCRHPFDEEVAGAEDALWAATVSAAGYRIVYVPEATAYHSHAAWPHIAWRRARRESQGVRRIHPDLQGFGLWRMLRMAAGLSWLDWWFALRHGCGPWWWPHIPLYRLAQAWGIYQGTRR